MQTPIAGLRLHTLIICLPLALTACDNDSPATSTGIVPLTQDTATTPTSSITGVIPSIPDTTTTPTSIAPDNQSPIAAVQAEAVAGSLIPGSPPAGTGDTTITVQNTTDESIVINGGSTIIPVSSEIPFSSIYVSSGQGSSTDPDYYEIQLPAALLSTDLVVTFQPTLNTTSRIPWLSVQTGSPTGEISQAETLLLDGVNVGTGDLQVSVSWSINSDVDLHLIEPDGTRIWFNDDYSSSGGQLDLDSNGACVIDGIRNENITYQYSQPPSGEYTIIVDYYLDCFQGPTDYIVTLRNHGQISTYRGVLNATDDRHTVATFQVR